VAFWPLSAPLPVRIDTPNVYTMVKKASREYNLLPKASRWPEWLICAERDILMPVA